MKIKSKKEKIYGIAGKIIYDKNSLELNKCEGNNNYEVNINNDIIVIDNAVTHNNSNMAICHFNIKNETDTNIILDDIVVNNYKKI